MSALLLIVTYVVIGSLFIGGAVPLIQGRVKPNPWYGVRVPKTLGNRDTWYAVNAYFGRRFAVVGLLIIVAGILLAPCAFIPHVGVMGYMILGHTIMLGSLLWIV